MYEIYIVWGSTIDSDSKPSHYKFATAAELDAFLLGIDEASGWLDYESFPTKEEALAHIKEESAEDDEDEEEEEEE